MTIESFLKEEEHDSYLYSFYRVTMAEISAVSQKVVTEQDDIPSDHWFWGTLTEIFILLSGITRLIPNWTIQW